MCSAWAVASALLATLVTLVLPITALDCSSTELTPETLEECVNAVRENPEAFAWSYPCPTWELPTVEALSPNSMLKGAAKDHTTDMVANNIFQHESSDGKKFSDRIWENGYQGDKVGENLAVGYRDALSVVGGWMCSPTHRANLLACAFNEFGTHIDCSSGKCYVAQEYGCNGNCCDEFGNAGRSSLLGGSFFSRIANWRPRRASAGGCEGLIGCFVQDILG